MGEPMRDVAIGRGEIAGQTTDMRQTLTVTQTLDSSVSVRLFDEVVDRRGTGSLKWNVADSELPCWVADMDFRTAPAVREALARVVERGVFGYAEPGEAWARAYCEWWRRRHGWRIDPSWLVYASGVVPIISSVVRKLTTPGEKVLLQTPVYNIFFNSVLNNGRLVKEAPLLRRGDAYEMDFAALERAMADPQVTLMVLCNPHNPVGRVWSSEELARVGELAQRHGVVVVSDEIHGDLTAPGVGYVPFASASPACAACAVTCLAPTKAFNIAGMQTAAAVVGDPQLRHKVWRALNTDEVGEPNAFACAATEAAFGHGEAWLDALRAYLWENRAHAERRLATEAPALHALHAQATYLQWIDCSKLCDDADAFVAFTRKRTGLVVNPGSEYGEAGRAFLRLNLACPRTTLDDALSRLARAAREWPRR